MTLLTTAVIPKLFKIGENVRFLAGETNCEMCLALKDREGLCGMVFRVTNVGPVSRYYHGVIPQMVTILLNGEEKIYPADLFERA